MPPNFAQGSTAAALAPPETNARGIRRKRPTSLLYDGGTRDHLLDPNVPAPYAYASVHPVDTRVNLKMHVRQGSIKSVPTLGNRFHLIALDDKADANVRAEVNRLLGPEVIAGDIRIDAIRSEVIDTGGLGAQVDYTNLRLRPATQRTTATRPT